MKKLISFKYNDKEYTIQSPTQEQLLRMDLEYRQAFSRAIRDGLMTEFEAKRVFAKNGTWTEEHDQEITDLNLQIVAHELDLDKIENGSEGRELAFKIMDLRNKLIDLINYKSRLFSAQTAEGYADAIKLSALTYECTVDDKGQRIFPTKESFCAHQDTEFTATCYSKAMMAEVGMTEEDIRPKFAERKWLEKNSYIDEKSAFTEKYYKELVGADEKPEEKPDAPKKRGRKPKEV